LAAARFDGGMQVHFVVKAIRPWVVATGAKPKAAVIIVVILAAPRSDAHE